MEVPMRRLFFFSILFSIFIFSTTTLRAATGRTCCESPGNDPSKCNACDYGTYWKNMGDDCGGDPSCRTCPASHPVGNACGSSEPPAGSCRYFTFNPTSITITQGQSVTVSASVVVDKTLGGITLTSNNASIATIGPSRQRVFNRNLCCSYTSGRAPRAGESSLLNYQINGETPGVTYITGAAKVMDESSACASNTLRVTVLPRATATPSPTPPVCLRDPVDIAIVVDFSGSMVYDSYTGKSLKKLEDAKAAAKSLAEDLFAVKDSQIRVGLVSFATCNNASQTTIRAKLGDYTNAATLRSAIDALVIPTGQEYLHTTCTHQGVQLANTLLSGQDQGAREGAKKLMIFLTDGYPNADGMDYQTAVQEALKASATSVGRNTMLVTIGLGDKTGKEFDEKLLQCMAGTGGSAAYYGQSCFLDRSVQGRYWYAPTSNDLDPIYSAIGQEILTERCLATPTPTPTSTATPTPTPTPLGSFRSTIEMDPSLTGKRPPQLVGGIFGQYCSSPDTGNPVTTGRIAASNKAGTNFPGAIASGGNYTISNLPGSSGGEYCITYTPAPGQVCSCPTGCRYCGKDIPTSEPLKFYVSTIGTAWYQTVGGDVAAQAASGTSVNNPIPASCVTPNCSPYLSLPLTPAEPQSGGALIARKSATIDLSSITGAQSNMVSSPGTSKLARLTDSLGCRENFAYFLRLYSLGLPPIPSDFAIPGDATKPTTPPSNSKAAYYYEGPELRILQPWVLQDGVAPESIVVFVKGNLRISNTITVPPGAFLAFIVAGNINIDATVGTSTVSSTRDGQVQGIFLADGALTVRGVPNGQEEKKFVGEGTFAACNGIAIERDFAKGGKGLDNNVWPASLFLYRPDLVKNTPERMKTTNFVWREVAP